MGAAMGISGTKVVAGTVEGDQIHYYDLTGNYWTRKQSISAPAGAGSFGSPYSSVNQVIALDGDRLAVGSPEFDGGSAVYTYTYNGAGFVYDGTKLTPAGGAVADREFFGKAIKIRGDLMAVAAPSHGGLTGAVYVYRATEAGWSSKATLVPSSAGPQSRVGFYGLALSENGRTIVATSNDGKFYSWKLGEDDQWHEDSFLTDIFTEPPFPDIDPEIPAPGTGFGLSIAMSGDRILGGSLFNKVNVYETDYSNTPYLASHIRAQIDQDAAAAHPLFNADLAAFLFKGKIYQKEGDEVLRSNVPVGTFFGPEQHARLDEAFAELKKRIAQAPLSPEYRDLYLDVIYDRAMLKMLEAQDELVALDQARLAPPTGGQGVIDNEITLYEANLPILRDALKIMLEPLDETFGIENSGVPYGYQFLQDRVPHRVLDPIRYDENGILKPLLDQSDQPITDPLIPGYKDAIFFFEILGEYGRSAAAMAGLHLQKTDDEEARGVLKSARDLLFVQGSIMRGIFRDPANAADPAELAEALAAWEQGISDLRDMEDSIDNGLNPLGYDDDFLVLLQRADGEDESNFNTFNILDARIDDEGSNSNYLKRAEEDRLAALAAYANYRGGLDELSVGIDAVRGDSESRLVQLVGADYGTATYNATPGPNVGVNGGFIPGSDLWDQFQTIRRARIQIQKNAAEIANLEEKVRIEAARNLFEVQQQNAISQVRVRYADRRASMEEELSRLNAAQKYTEVLADAMNPANWGQVIGNAINGGVQVYGELRKGEIAAERERMAAQEEADITAANNSVLRQNSAALIATWLLDMKTLVLSSQESAIILQQEMGRLLGLMRERRTLERRIEAHSSTLKNRYFADPVHRLRYLNELVIANRTFEIAQRTVFFMARALEYKWNEEFDDFMLGTGTSMAKVYSARNSEELQKIVDDMRQRDDTNTGVTDYEDVFSLKEDAFGYVEGQMHSDPQSGQMVSATQAFRSLLEKEFLIGQPGIDNTVRLSIPFSTVRDPLVNLGSQQTFFRGARDTIVDPDGSIVPATPDSPKGNFLDKIDTLAVTMPGTYTSGRLAAPCDLKYGGTGFLRTRSLGRYQEMLDDDTNEKRFDRLSEGLTAIPTRAVTFLSGGWQTKNELTATPRLLLSNAAPQEIDYVGIFRERSVACNGWQIVITLSEEAGGGSIRYADLAEIDDIFLHFRHKASPRQ